MDVETVLLELRSELARTDPAILTLERPDRPTSGLFPARGRERIRSRIAGAGAELARNLCRRRQKRHCSVSQPQR
jgi:hypothetical protein